MNYWFYGDPYNWETIKNTLEFLGIDNNMSYEFSDNNYFYYTACDNSTGTEQVLGLEVDGNEELIEYLRTHQHIQQLPLIPQPKFKVGWTIRPKDSYFYYKIEGIGLPKQDFPQGYYHCSYNWGYSWQDIPINVQEKYTIASEYEICLKDCIDWLDDHVNEYVFNDKHNGRDWLKVRSDLFTDMRDYILGKK